MAGYSNDQGEGGGAIPVYITPGSGGISPYAYNPLGYQQLAVTTAQHLTVPTGAVTCFIIPSAPVRWRDDGVAPTASIGMPVAANVQFTYSGNLSAIQFIGAAAVLDISYYQ